MPPARAHHSRGAGSHDEEPQSRRQKEIAATRKLLGQADDLLAQVDDSFIMKRNRPRDYPTFDRSEIKIGPLLGVGGFCLVFEVKDFELKVPQEVELHVPTESTANESTANESPASTATGSVSFAPLDGRSEVVSESKSRDDSAPAGRATNPQVARNNSDGSQTTATSVTVANEGEQLSRQVTVSSCSKVHFLGPQDDSHYDVREARVLMAAHVQRNGSARFAIKRLHRDLSDLERARGMIDLALEAKYLSALWHPNIVKMRSVASGPWLSPSFFIVMDRLYEILDVKMKQWSQIERANRGGLFGRGANRLELHQLLVERLIVAYDLAAAFWYMHQNKLVYRDCKQENIGFDIRGDVKIFDFGLCKSLSSNLKARDSSGREVYGYKLTARTGSVPYMAPEVAECKPYDTKCDVFSFSILLWEIMSMKVAFKGYSRREFLERVVRGRERLGINRRWPPLTRLVMREGWDNDPQKRPDMKRVAALLRGDLNEMTSDSKVRDRTVHMRNRSSHSSRLSRGENLGTTSRQ